MSSHDNLADQLWQARLNGTTVSNLQAPTTVDEAYALQRVTTTRCAQQVNGFKIGATVTDIQKLLQLDEPFYGPLYSDFTRNNGCDLAVYPDHLPRIEPEFVVRLGKPLKASRGKPVSRDQVIDAVASISVAFEFVGSRVNPDLVTDSNRGLLAIADFGANLDFIMDLEREDWQDIDLSASPVELFINDESIATGHSGLSVAGNPLDIAAWLANAPGLADTGVDAGMLISCGTCTPAFAVNPGDKVRANYRDFGDLTCTIVKAENPA